MIWWTECRRRRALTQARTHIRANAVRPSTSRVWSRSGCRRKGFRSRFDRARRLLIELASYLQSVANLVTPNRRSRLRAFFTCDGAVVKTLVLESLLQ